MNTIPLTVIIPTYNREKVLLQTLESLLKSESVPDQIIVVDQTVPPISLSTKIVETGIVHVVCSKEPSSTKSRNIGLTVAKNELILFCDDDILVNKDSIRELYEVMQSEKMALVAAIDYRENVLFSNIKKSPLREVAGSLMGLKKVWRHDGYVIKSSMRGRYAAGISQITKTEWAMGYFFCIRRSLVEKWNIHFDEKLKRYAYAEDLDFTYRYCLHAKDEQFITVVDPSIYVNHLASNEWRTPTERATLYNIVNRRYLSYKLFPQKSLYRMAIDWFDILYLITQYRNRPYYLAIKKALIIARKHRREIKQGSLELIY